MIKVKLECNNTEMLKVFKFMDDNDILYDYEFACANWDSTDGDCMGEHGGKCDQIPCISYDDGEV